MCLGRWPPNPTAKQWWLGLTLLPCSQTYGMPAALDLAKQLYPGVLAWHQPHLPEACTVAWTVWLKSSCPPDFDHCFLDGHLPHIVWQPEGMVAS